ncbi:MAG: hypothetical protein ACXVIX_11140 [Halobacteriota archaeon]
MNFDLGKGRLNSDFVPMFRPPQGGLQASMAITHLQNPRVAAHRSISEAIKDSRFV